MPQHAINPNTGKKRRIPLQNVSRRSKRQKGLCAQDVRLLEQIHSAYDQHMEIVQLVFSFLMVMRHFVNAGQLIDLLVSFGAQYILPSLIQMATLIELDAEIGDVGDEIVPYRKAMDIKLIDDIESDDLATNLTNFSKEELKEMIVLFDFDDELRVPSGKRNAPNRNEPYKYTV